jgi:hypothetical protein
MQGHESHRVCPTVEKRHVGSYFISIAKSRKRGGQLALDTEWTQDRIEESIFINRVSVSLTF